MLLVHSTRKTEVAIWSDKKALHHTNMNITVKMILINFKRSVVKFFQVNINLALEEIVRASDGGPIIDVLILTVRGGIQDTRLEAKAKDTKKIRGQGQEQPFRGQTLSRPRTGMLEAKDTSASALQKKRSSQKFF